MAELEALKQQAAVRAAALVQSGTRIGLGTGSTARYAILELGRRLAAGELEGVMAVATSQASEDLARSLNIPVEPLTPEPLDIVIDGADEIDPQLNLIKGLGGALTREKLVEVQARRFAVIADHTKLVSRLGEKAPLPIEVVQFGVDSTVERLRALGARGELRRDAGALYITDNGNYIFHAHFPENASLASLERSLKGVLGVVETGLFLGMATVAYVATPEGVRELHAGA
ncbi:ribose 5-phosphate isomerase A [Deinococcus sonorensis]|uniref:Ribose-5-phosphate isomerase A n=2 Tax=Deinococcus sonorensis TaxID=309891 RepID=A0AAU7UA79_9DEIO